MNNPKKYKKKPVTVEAMQWTGENSKDLRDWTGTFQPFKHPAFGLATGTKYTGHVWVAANDYWCRVETGEWIIKDSKGFYPCKEDVFAATYEEVDG